MEQLPVLYDGMTFIYAVCVFLYFIDFLHPNKTVNRTALGLITVVWVLQSVFLVKRSIDLGHFPIYSLAESLVLFAWILVTFSLLINSLFKIDLFTFFANVIGFAVVVFDTFTRESIAVPSSEQGDLLTFHIAMAFLSYASFAVSFIFSVMYLIQQRLLKEKRWTITFRRLPALDRLEVYSYRFVIIGFPMLVLAMILGVVWYDIQFGRLLWLDAKPIVSVLSILLYGIYLYLRVAAGWLGKRLAWLNVCAFGAVIINYLVVGTFFSGFHRS